MKQELTSNESQRLMNMLANVAAWSISSSGEIWWCDGLYELYGMNKRDGITLEAFEERVYPSDYIKFKEGIKTAINEGKTFEEKARVRINNRYQWVKISGKYLDDGTVVGVTQNIDEFYREFHELKQNISIIKVLASSPNGNMNSIKTLLDND